MSVSPSLPTANDARGPRLEALVLAVAFILVNVLAALTQKQITFNDGKGWEGVAYYAVAQQFAEGRVPVEADAPEVYRVGTPFLASIIRNTTGWNLFTCFKFVNGTANALTLVLLVCWLRHFIGDWRVRLGLGLAFLLQWDTPTRWMYFFPAHTDPWMWVFLLGSLLAVEKYRRSSSLLWLAAVTVIVAVGVAFREVVLVVACTMPFLGNPLPTANFRTVISTGQWRTVARGIFPSLLPRLVPFVAGLAVMLIVRRFVSHQENSYSFALTASHWLYEKSWLTYVHGWFLGFGPILWLAIFQLRKAWPFLGRHQYLAAYAGAFALLGYIGGTDTERLLYWSMPVIYILIGQGLEMRRHALRGVALGVLTGAQLLADRAFFWPIPDYPLDVPHAWPLFTPLGRNIPFLDLYSFWELRLLGLTSLLTYLAFGACLAAWIVWVDSRPRPAAGASPILA